MLSRTWFAPKTADSHPPSPPPHDVPQQSSPRPSIDRAITAALSTPHDAVLAELQGRPMDPSSHLPAIPSVGSLELGPNASISGGGSHSQPTSPDLSPEPVYDPFSGHLAFILPPQAPTDPAHDETTKHELWTQLGRIRELQSEIAIMHTRMEGIGLGEHRHPKKGPVRTHTDTIVVGEEWADAAEEEHDKRKARDAEFENLAQAFEGRHAAIDEIMDKLGDLSKTLTAFHALPTPTMDFARKNTKDSMATMFSSPSPTFTTVPTSPFSPTASPTSAHQTAPNIIQAELDKLEIPRAESPASVASASVDGSS